MSKNKPDKPVTLALEVTSIKRTRKRIEIAYSQGEGDFDLAERDNPLPSFTAAFDALVPLVATICHLTSDYVATNCRVTGVLLGTQGGAQTVALIARKGLDDASKEFVIKTPFRLLAHPTEEGGYTPALHPVQAELVAEVVEEAKKYIRGERAQGQIILEGEDDTDDEGGDSNEEEKAQGNLPLAAPEMAHNQPKQKRGRKKKVEQFPTAAAAK